MESLDEELAAIEEATCYAPQSPVASSSCVETQVYGGNTTSSPHNNVKGTSSGVSKESDIQSMKDVSAVPTKAKQRNSMSLNGSMMPNLAELQDLAGSDSDREEPSPTPAQHDPMKTCGGPVSGEGDIQSMKDVTVVSRKASQRNSLSLNGSMIPNLSELQGLDDSDSDEKEASFTPSNTTVSRKVRQRNSVSLNGSMMPSNTLAELQALAGSDNDEAPVSRKARQRNSVSLNGSMMPSNTLADLQALAGSDNDEEEPPFIPAPHVPNLKACGGPQHRPLVGGFAAAAYEAARVDYYKKRGVSVRGHQPSKPRRSAPRYP